MSGLRHRRATAAFLRPIAQRLRASRRAAQPGSGIDPPPVKPVPSHEAPTLTEPRQVSSPAALRPGANTAGTFDSEPELWTFVEVTAGEPAMLTAELALLRPPAPPAPPCPEIATAVEDDLAMPTPTPVADEFASPASTGVAEIAKQLATKNKLRIYMNSPLRCDDLTR